MVDTTLEAKDSPKYFEVRLSELVIVSRAEGPRQKTCTAESQPPRPSAGRRTFRVSRAAVTSRTSGTNRL